MRTDDLLGALWFPADGKANPTDLTMSLARGAQSWRDHPAGREVNGITLSNGAVSGVSTTAGDIALPNPRQLHGSMGATSVLWQVLPCRWRRPSISTSSPSRSRIDPDTPVMRDPDGLIYFCWEAVGG